MMPSRGMGDMRPSKMPKARTITRKDDPNEVTVFKAGGKSRVNEAGNYTKPGMRKALFERIKAGGKGGAPGQWSARKAQMLAQQYKKSGGGYNLLLRGQRPLVNAIYQNQPLSHYLPPSMQLLQGLNGQVKLRVSSSCLNLRELQRKQRGLDSDYFWYRSI
jgi:hypothetical protein